MKDDAIVLQPDEVEAEWYVILVEECKAIITETIFNSRWALVEGYHALGERILQENDNFAREKIYGQKILQGLAKSLNTSERTLYYAVQFAKEYPDLGTVPEGKNITWNKIITKYLPAFENQENILAPVEGEHEVIVIDPPWPYGTEYDKDSRRVASPYPELSIEQLEAFKLPAAQDCVLWLWTTHRFLRDAYHLVETWGFDYKVCLVWDKEKLGMGAWLRCQVEFCLLAIKGHPKWKLTNERDILKKARGRHSAKPDNFYYMVEKLCPTNGIRADIFARKERDGWKVIGNEV